METPPDRDLPGIATSEDETFAPEVSLKRIQIINLCILIVALLASLRISRGFALGVALVGVLMAANFVVIAAVIRSVFQKGKTSALNIGIYWAKFTGILLAIGALIVFFRVDVVGLLVGLSTILVAITLEALLRLAGK